MVNKHRESFIINHCFGDIEYDTKQFSHRNRYYIDSDLIELLSQSKNMLIRNINVYNKNIKQCNKNSFTNDFIFNSSDIMEKICNDAHSLTDLFLIYCIESNENVHKSLELKDDTKFDYYHVWNQLCC